MRLNRVTFKLCKIIDFESSTRLVRVFNGSFCRKNWVNFGCFNSHKVFMYHQQSGFLEALSSDSRAYLSDSMTYFASKIVSRNDCTVSWVKFTILEVK